MDKEAFEQWLAENEIEGGPWTFHIMDVRELYTLLTPRWVPVNERLPEDGLMRSVVTEDPNGNREPAEAFLSLTSKRWLSEYLGRVDNVTHWWSVPIPPLPEVSDAS